MDTESSSIGKGPANPRFNLKRWATPSPTDLVLRRGRLPTPWARPRSIRHRTCCTGASVDTCLTSPRRRHLIYAVVDVTHIVSNWYPCRHPRGDRLRRDRVQNPTTVDQHLHPYRGVLLPAVIGTVGLLRGKSARVYGMMRTSSTRLASGRFPLDAQRPRREMLMKRSHRHETSKVLVCQRALVGAADRVNFAVSGSARA